MEKVGEVRTALHNVVRSGVASAVQRKAEELVHPGSEGLVRLLEAAVVEGIELALGEVSEQNATRMLGAERYSRSASRAGSRSFYLSTSVVTPFGPLELRFVKSHGGALRPAFARNARRFASEVAALGSELWVRGARSSRRRG